MRLNLFINFLKALLFLISFQTSSIYLCFAEDIPLITKPHSPHFYIKIMDETDHTLQGFGVQIDQGDNRAKQVIKDLKLKYVRVEVGPTWFFIDELPESGSPQTAVNEFVEKNFNFDFPDRLINAKKVWCWAERFGFKILLNFFDIPCAWIKHEEDLNRRILKEANVEDFGRLWLGIITYLRKYQMVPDYLELANEPDGNWNGAILPIQYDTLIRFVRRGLDDQQLTNVGIIGPGLSNLEKDGKTALQIEGLSQEGVNSLSAWSTHAWDEWHDQTSDHSHHLMRTQWEKFRNAIKKKDSQLSKPIFVTEYSSASIKYFGQWYATSKNQEGPLAVDTHSYARRVYQNTLINMNAGANVMIIWSAAGQDWDSKHTGLLSKPSEGSKKRPMYSSLMTLLPYIPSMSDILKVSHNEDLDMVVAAAKSGSQLVIAVSNPMPYEQFANFNLSAFKVSSINKSIRHQMDIIDTAQMNIKWKGNTLETKMPADTTTTIIIQLL